MMNVISDILPIPPSTVRYAQASESPQNRTEHIRPRDALCAPPRPTGPPAHLHPDSHTTDAYPNTVKSLLVAPQSLWPKTHRLPKTRRPTPQTLLTSKIPSVHVAHVKHGPGCKSRTHLCWKESYCICNLRSPHSYAPCFSLVLDFPLSILHFLLLL